MKNKLKIIADSTCDLSQDIIDEYDIGIIHLNLIIGDEVYVDRVDMTADELFKILPELETLPTTSMPSPEAFIHKIKKAVEEGYKDIVFILQSSGTSGTYQTAELAKCMYMEPGIEDIRIHMVDSLGMSHGHGWLVLKAARLRQEGKNYDDIVEYCEKHKKQVKHLLSVEDLNNLIKSGRLSNESAFIGKLLKVQPIMTMKNSRGAITAKVRGRKNALKHYASEYTKRVDEELTDFIIIGYSSDVSLADNLLRRMKTVTDIEIFVMQMGTAVSTHVGFGGLSMYFMEKENANICEKIRG